jgi:hypothetical protein
MHEKADEPWRGRLDEIRRNFLALFFILIIVLVSGAAQDQRWIVNWLAGYW